MRAIVCKTHFAVLLLLLLLAPAFAEVPQHEPSLDYKCKPGFQWSRGTISCKQADCPEGARRTYTYDCSCWVSEWGGEPKVTCYDKNGLAVKCLPKGSKCDEAPSGGGGTGGGTVSSCGKGLVYEDGLGCIRIASDAEIACKKVKGAKWDSDAEKCECKAGFEFTPDRKACKKEAEPQFMDEGEQCRSEGIRQANDVYRQINASVSKYSAPGSGQRLSFDRALAAIEKGTVVSEFKGISAAKPGKAKEEPKKEVPVLGRGTDPSRLELSEATLRQIDSTIKGVEEGNEPEWLGEVPTHAGFFREFGSALIENAPQEVRNSNDCVKAKYVFGLGMPILDKKYGYRQLDGSTALGACNVLLSRRGFVRIADTFILTPYDYLGEMIDKVKQRQHYDMTMSPESTLRLTGQGTCGEWAYGLKDIMDGAGLKSDVIVAYEKGKGALINHAATVIECKVDGRVEKRVCDAWYLGHENQRRDMVFSYGHFDNASRSVHNCRSLDDWKDAQKGDGKGSFFNPDYTGIKDDDFYSSRDMALESVKEGIEKYAPVALEKGWGSDKLKRVMRERFIDLMPGEEDALLAGLLEEYGRKVNDAAKKKRLDEIVAELRRSK